MAGGMREGFAATMMMEIARMYDRMADRAAITDIEGGSRSGGFFRLVWPPPETGSS